MTTTHDREPPRVLPPREEMPGRQLPIGVDVSRKDQAAQQQQ